MNAPFLTKLEPAPRQTDLGFLAGLGFVPFLVTEARVVFSARRTSVVVDLLLEEPLNDAVQLVFLIEGYPRWKVRRGIDALSNLCAHLGAAGTDDLDAIENRRGALRFDSRHLEFASLSFREVA